MSALPPVLLVASTLLCACDPGYQPIRPEQTGAMSDCGGFDNAPTRSNTADDLETYCAAERLFVSYDAESARMTLALRRTEFNCCTEVDPEVTIDEDGTYVLDLHEDYLPGETAICGCGCIFDLDRTVNEVAAGQIVLRVRSWFHEDPPWTKLADTVVDLGPEPVEIILSDAPTSTPPCYEEEW